MTTFNQNAGLILFGLFLLTTAGDGAFAPITKSCKRATFNPIPPSFGLGPIRKNCNPLLAVSPDVSIVPRITQEQLQELQTKGLLIVDDFLPRDMQEALWDDVRTLREQSKFKIAKIGQDSTNTLNTDIRIAETSFLGPDKLKDVPNKARSHLYTILEQLRQDLQPPPLDSNLSEYLYAYYPTGGFYRRHRDAIPGSASILRKFSLLLYLNLDWDAENDGGALRLHMDSGGDFLPDKEEPNYQDVVPTGGKLVLFQSDKIPHEVLDTNAERLAVVGWYNRPVTASDVAELAGVGGSAGDGSSIQMLALAVAAGLVTVGLVNLLS